MVPITRPLLLLVIVVLLLYFRQQTQTAIKKTAIKTMPLVVPGLQSKGGDDKTNKWMNDLVGKKIGEQSDEITFAKKDLPKEHRILSSDSISTTDFNPDRLNIYTGPDGTVTSVKHG